MGKNCWKCNGDGLYCWTCGEPETYCECEKQNIKTCDLCDGYGELEED